MRLQIRCTVLLLTLAARATERTLALAPCRRARHLFDDRRNSLTRKAGFAPRALEHQKYSPNSLHQNAVTT